MLKRILLASIGLGAMTSCQSVGQTPPKKLIPVVYSSKSTINLFGLERMHPFDIKKYDKIHKGLKTGGFTTEESSHAPEQLTREDLLLVHSEQYLENLKDKQLVASYLEAPVIAKIPGINIEKNVVQPFITASGGTLAAARLAMKHGAAINLGGGYHHAMPDRGEGFCIIADVPITIRKLQKEGVIKRALVIDTDIHQGNGTNVCLQDDPTTYTFSMHEMDIYPWPKPEGNLDLLIQKGVTDAEFNTSLERMLPRVFIESKPDIVFHVAGCDSLAGDPLANGKMSSAGIAARDLLVYQYCQKRNIPYVMTLAGGYSKNAWKAQMDSIKGLMNAE